MKKILFLIILLLTSSIQFAKPIKLCLLDLSGANDIQGHRLVQALRNYVNNTNEFEVFDSPIDSVFVVSMQTIDPDLDFDAEGKRTVYSYGLYYSTGLYFLMVNSSLAFSGADRIQEAAEVIVSLIHRDVKTFYDTYPNLK
jgi:hypothetical protein